MATRRIGNLTINYTPTEAQTQMYNTLGRDAGTAAASGSDDNFFTKRWKSIDNAIGTTGAALYESGGNLLGAALAGLTGGDYTSAVSARQNAKTDQLLKDNKEKMNNIYKKYGYDNAQAYHDAKKSAQDEVFSRYGFNDEDFGNKRAEADLAGDSARVAELEKERQDVISRMSSEDADKIRRFDSIQNELINQSQANVDAVDKNAADYRDYVENNDVSKRINQDRGKFLGSAINTLSTATDLLGLTNGPIANAIQGGVEGIADELEQNGLNNFDWNRAGQNALVGAASGAATGMLNNAIDSRLAGKGGNLFKGNNALTNGINNFNQNTGLGRLASTLGTGMARGAQSGAVGGAVGAGLSSAMNGAEVGQGIANALQGAVQGAGQGAVAGGTMAGANMVINKTPGINRFMQDVNEAKQNWQNSGDNFAERLNNTRANNDTWGNRFLDNQVENVKAVGQGFKNVGEGLGVLAERSGVKDVATANPSDLVSAMRGKGNDVVLQEALKNPGLRNRFIDTADDTVTTRYNNERRPDIAQALQNGVDNNMDGFLMRQKLYDEANDIRSKNGMTPWDTRQMTLDAKRTGEYKGGIAGHYMKHAGEMGGANGITDAMYKIATDNNSVAMPTDLNTLLANNKAQNGVSPAAMAVDDDLTIRGVSPRSKNWMEQNNNARTALLDNSLDGGNRPSLQSADAEGSGFPFSARQATDSILPQTQSDVKSMSRDVQNMRIVNNTDSPETEVYRRITGNSTQPEIQAEPDKTSKEYSYRQKRNEKLLDQYNIIDKPTAKAVRAVETVGQIADAGFEKPADVEAAIKKITGSDGALNKLNRKVIANAGDINTMDGVDQGTSLNDFIDQQIRLNGLYGTSDGKALTTEIEAVMNKLPSRRNGSITGLDSAEDVFDVIQTLEKHSANYKGKSGNNYGTSNPYKDQKAAVIDSLSTMLKDRIYDASDVTKVVTPEVIDDMKSWYPNNKKWATWVDENIATARTGADLRSAQAPFVRMGKIIDNGVVNSGTFGSKVPRYVLRMATSNPLGIVVNGVEMFSETPIGKRMAAKGYEKLADRAASKSNPTGTNTIAQSETPTATTSYDPATQVYNAIGRTTGEIEGEKAAGNYLNAANQEDKLTTLDSLASNAGPTSSTSVYNSLYGNSYGSSTGDSYSDLLQRAMEMAMADGNANAFASLLTMYNDYSQKNTSTNQTKLTDKQRQANAAQRALNDFEQVESNFAYDVSDIPIIGGLANLGGNEYASKAEALALQVGYMLSGATVNKEEAKNIGMAYVPQPRDSEAVRQSKLRQLRGIIADYQQTYGE